MLLSCVSTVASASILPAGARHPCLVGKKNVAGWATWNLTTGRGISSALP